MANLRDLKGRISTIKNIKQITNAMKMVAAAKLRKTQDAVIAARPYAEHVDKMLRILQGCILGSRPLQSLCNRTRTDQSIYLV